MSGKRVLAVNARFCIRQMLNAKVNSQGYKNFDHYACFYNVVEYRNIDFLTHQQKEQLLRYKGSSNIVHLSKFARTQEDPDVKCKSVLDCITRVKNYEVRRENFVSR